MFESTAALGLLPSRALSSEWTPGSLSPHPFFPRLRSPKISGFFPKGTGKARQRCPQKNTPDHPAFSSTLLKSPPNHPLAWEKSLFYCARDYRAIGITDEALESLCRITQQSPSIAKGAGWTMVLLMFQIRSTTVLLDQSENSQQVPLLLTAAREGCQFMMDNFDHVLRH